MARGYPLTEEQRQQVVELTRQGYSAPQIAERLNCAKRTVQRVREDFSIAQSPPRRYTPDELATIELLLDDGASIAEAARTVGCSYDYLTRRHRGRGWTPAQAGQFKNLLRKMRLGI